MKMRRGSGGRAMCGQSTGHFSFVRGFPLLAGAALASLGCGADSDKAGAGGNTIGTTGGAAGAASPGAGGATNPGSGGATVTANGGAVTASGGAVVASGGATGSGGAMGTNTGGASTAGAGGGTAGTSGGGVSGMSGGGTSGAGGTSGGACSRDALKSALDAYYAAMAAHDPTKAPLATSVKLTENGKTMMVGDGLWKTAGMVKFKRSAYDTVSCNSATESVLPEMSTDRIFGVRLKLADQKITEIETIIVRSGDYILNNPPGLSGSAKDDWETVLPADKQSTREALQKVMDDYLTKFPSGACGFASDCTRLEDGGSVGTCVDGSLVKCDPNAMAGRGGMKARLHVIDVEAGITVGFTMFAGTYTDFHLFKMRDGEVHGVHAVLAKASSSGWD